MRKFLDRLQGGGNGAVLARGALGAFIVKITGAGVLFGLHVLLAQLLSVDEYGIYVYAITWINILAILCLLGFQTSLVRFIAEYNAKAQWGLLRGIIRKSSQFVLPLSIIVGIVGAIIILSLEKEIGSELAVTLFIAFASLPVLALCHLREACLRALRHVVQSEVLLRVIRPTLLGLVVITLCFSLRGTVKPVYVMAGNFVAIVGVFITGTILLHKALPSQARQQRPEYEGKQWLKVSLPLLLVAGMHIILKRTDIVMLGLLRGYGDAGIYSVASRISDLVVFALMATNIILAPMISELYHTGRNQELQKIITLAARAIFVFTLMVSIVLALCGKSILSLFGLKFVIAFVPLVVLLCGQIIRALCGSVSDIMTMSGRQNYLGIIVTISATTNILLNLLLIPLLGMLGAAVSTTFTLSIWNIVMLVYVQRKIGINPTLFKKLGAAK